MCLALITEVIALIWTIISMCACCCKQCCIFLLPILALIASIFLAVAVIVFGINNKDFISKLKCLLLFELPHYSYNKFDVFPLVKVPVTKLRPDCFANRFV
uniref:Protein tweety homolog n=1 Tax=Ascaris lumbricoides TaxID=6252 RepID=A0A0M3HIN1_ASCLU